jgi:hypothetical protein
MCFFPQEIKKKDKKNMSSPKPTSEKTGPSEETGI